MHYSSENGIALPVDVVRTMSTNDESVHGKLRAFERHDMFSKDGE